MTVAVLDSRVRPPRPRPRMLDVRSWHDVAGGALPSTLVFAAAAALLLAGVLPVVERGAVHAGLAVAFAATAVGWAARRSTPAVRSLAVPVAHLVAVGLLYAGTATPTMLFTLLGPLWVLATHPGRHGVPVAVAGTTAVLAVPHLMGSLPAAVDLPGALLLGPLVVAVGSIAVNENTRRLATQADQIVRLQREQAALLEQVRSRADELDTASRILAARAQTMTSVIDAVTEQSIIGTDRDGTIRVWNPGAEKMLGLLRPDVVRTRTILDFHLPE